MIREDSLYPVPPNQSPCGRTPRFMQNTQIHAPRQTEEAVTLFFVLFLVFSFASASVLYFKELCVVVLSRVYHFLSYVLHKLELVCRSYTCTHPCRKHSLVPYTLMDEGVTKML